MSQCKSLFKDGGSTLRCILTEGHAEQHQCESWEWWEEAAEKPRPPVATQLERIEQGLDKLMQSHAALDAKLDNWKKEPTDERHAVLCGKLDGIRDGLTDEIKQLTAAVSFFAQTALNRNRKPPRPAKRGKR